VKNRFGFLCNSLLKETVKNYQKWFISAKVIFKKTTGNAAAGFFKRPAALP